MNRKSIALVLLLAGMAVLCVLAVHIDERNVSFCLGKYDRLAVRIRAITFLMFDFIFAYLSVLIDGCLLPDEGYTGCAF